MNQRIPQKSALQFAIGGCLTMAMVMGIGRFVYTPILPGMMADVGFNPADAGVIASANYIGYFLGAIFAGYSWSHGRERGAVLAAITISGLLCIAMALTQTVWMFTAIRFAAGFASAIGMILSTTIVFSHIVMAGRSEFGAFHFGGVGVGIVVSALVVVLSHLAGFGWRADWLIAGVVSLIAAAIVSKLITEGPLITSNGHKEPPLPKSLAFYGVSVAYALYGFGYIITATFLVAIVRDHHGGPTMEATVFIIMGLSAAPSIWAWSPLVRKMGAFSALGVILIVEAIGVAGSVLLPMPYGPFIGAALLGGTFMAVTAYAVQAARSQVPLSPKKGLAVTTVFLSFGQVVGPIVAGFMVKQSGSYYSASIAAAVSILLAAVVAFASGRVATEG